MAEYYYLVSTLTYLKFGEEPPLGSKKFLAECARWLSAGDMKILSRASRGGLEARAQDAPVLAEWKSFDGRLRGELAGVRAARGKEETYKASGAVKAILSQENPLLAETEFEKARWDFLEDMAARYFFDINALIVYFLKLQILERLARFDKDAGEKFFYHYCEVDYEKKVRQYNGD